MTTTPWPDAVSPEQIAQRAKLTYVAEDAPGLSRRRCGRGFTYLDHAGCTLRDERERERIEALAIPPAWTEVWISADPDGHVLATGRDDRQRKQYRYHPRWDAERDRVKFEQLLAFGGTLPALRRRIGRGLGRDRSDAEFVHCTAARLLDRTGIRVGHAEYAEDNGTVGLTTLQGRHVRVRGDRVELDFVGKGGTDISVQVDDARLARAMAALASGPRTLVFRFRAEGRRRPLDADELNAWLRDAVDPGCSAKQFRTWRATVAVIAHLAAEERPAADGRSGRFLEAVDHAADLLCNTRSVLRTSYLPPGLEALYVEGPFDRVVEAARRQASNDATTGRSTEERLALPVLRWLVAA
ncbi:DNA topoisomerase IB [Gaopeijia maritima]|uniref:DNA topoisomerase n=1 Tax=Gaopeijia maritima TaxID=3119007 RepID=A0ABU9E826_9BACT